MRGNALVLLVVMGCAGDAPANSADEVATHRYRNRESKYSLDAPETWKVSEERGSAIFERPGTRHAIVVRSAPKPREILDGKRTSAEDVLSSTELALTALPGSKIERRWQIVESDMPAAAFALTFNPRTAMGKTYQRTHVVLVGRTRLFHVIYTAPAGEPIASAILEDMVAGLKEEV